MKKHLPKLFALLLVFRTTTALADDFIHHGTPLGVPKEADCAFRVEAYRFGQSLMPERKGFKSLYDALQLHVCGIEQPKDPDMRPVLDEPFRKNEKFVVVFPSGSSYTSVKRQLKVMHRNIHFAHSINEGLQLAKEVRDQFRLKFITVALKGGVHYVSETVRLSPEHFGIKLRNFPGERAVVSGGKPLKTTWKQSKACRAKNCYEADLSSQDIDHVHGLRLNGQRLIRARYPNFNPERSSVIDGKLNVLDGRSGWVKDKTEWLKTGKHAMNGIKGWPPSKEAIDLVVGAKDWPSADWPMHIFTNSTIDEDHWTGEGSWGDFHLGYGGNCADRTPPIGYWCTRRAPRMASPANHPVGVNLTQAVAPNLPYANPQGAVVHSWRHAHWFTNTMRVGDSYTERHGDSISQVLLFDKGGTQGGEGDAEGESWYIENVLEELDMPGEFYFDKSSSAIYYIPNNTIPSESGFVATNLRVIFWIEGTQSNPVCNLSISGLELRDTSYGYFEPHGLPSGGDWALARQGAITAFGTEGLAISNNIFTKLDGNAIFAGDYHRGMSITQNEFEGIGDTAIALWGSTTNCMNENCSIHIPYKVGPDGRKGNQPRGTKVVHNLAHELGIWQKQSSFLFQAVSAESIVSNNIFFNGPRAAINFNDAFGGGDNVHSNLLLNSCRESGDHGPFNSWNRLPYITNLRSGQPSIIPKQRRFHHNFVMANYNSQEGFDTDDGSAYFTFDHNVQIYGENGLKFDFGGHDVTFLSNLLLYVHNCITISSFKGYNDVFKSNTCVFRGVYNSDCHMDHSFKVQENYLFSKNGKLSVCGMPFEKWQALGHDTKSSLKPWPKNDEIIRWMRQMLKY